jgi:hypothetical protein
MQETPSLYNRIFIFLLEMHLSRLLGNILLFVPRKVELRIQLATLQLHLTLLNIECYKIILDMDKN